MRETAALALCVLPKQKEELASWFCHSRQDNETPCKKQPARSKSGYIVTGLTLVCEDRGSRSTASIPSTVNELSVGVSIPAAASWIVSPAVKRTNWFRGFVTRDKTMKCLAKSNRPVVNQANAFDSRLR